MRALSFIGYSKNEINEYVIPLKLSVGPESSKESLASPSKASQFLEAFENKNSKTSVDESPEVVPNHGTIEWTGDDWRAPANPVSDKVSDLSENMASAASSSASDFSRKEITSHDADDTFSEQQ